MTADYTVHELSDRAQQGTVSHVEKLVRVYRRVERADERDAANARYADRYLQAFVDTMEPW